MEGKTKIGMMMAAGLGMAASMEDERWGRSRKTMANYGQNKRAKPGRKARRKTKQASRRNNRKK